MRNVWGFDFINQVSQLGRTPKNRKMLERLPYAIKQVAPHHQPFPIE